MPDIFVNNYHLGTFDTVEYDSTTATLYNGFISDYRLISWLQGQQDSFDIDIVNNDSHVCIHGFVMQFSNNAAKIHFIKLSMDDMITMS